jgi:hypothetical protein
MRSRRRKRERLCSGGGVEGIFLSLIRACGGLPRDTFLLLFLVSPVLRFGAGQAVFFVLHGLLESEGPQPSGFLSRPEVITFFSFNIPA